MAHFRRSARHLYQRVLKKINQGFSKGKAAVASASNHSSSLPLAIESRTADEIGTQRDPPDVSIAPEAPPLTHAEPLESVLNTTVVQSGPISSAEVVEKVPRVSIAKQPKNSLVASTAPQSNPDGTYDQHTQPLLHEKSAPIWNNALDKLKTLHPERYAALEDTIREIPDSKASDIFDKIPKRILGNSATNEVVQRMKQFLPSLAALRGIAMTAAALDPHKIAPIVCASVFFSIDVSFLNFP